MYLNALIHKEKIIQMFINSQLLIYVGVHCESHVSRSKRKGSRRGSLVLRQIQSKVFILDTQIFVHYCWPVLRSFALGHIPHRL